MHRRGRLRLHRQARGRAPAALHAARVDVPVSPLVSSSRTGEAASRAPQADTDKIHILLVDDHPSNLLSLETILEGRDFSLVRALSGPDALRAMLKQEFALVLLDVLMPGMDGFATAALIRK